jgi:hypothetical protein
VTFESEKIELWKVAKRGEKRNQNVSKWHKLEVTGTLNRKPKFPFLIKQFYIDNVGAFYGMSSCGSQL